MVRIADADRLEQVIVNKEDWHPQVLAAIPVLFEMIDGCVIGEMEEEE